MSFRRIILSVPGLLVVISFLTLSANYGQQKPTTIVLTIPCTTTIQVTATGVNPTDAYVCAHGSVTWNANGHEFSVAFKRACPFPNCNHIDNAHPTAGPIKDLAALTVYDYGITIDGITYDPHIVGGGG
jgi:hypothetical protein